MELIVFVVLSFLPIVVGAIVIYLGYRLYTQGVSAKEGDVSAAWKDTQVVLKNITPGAFLALLGTVIIVVSVIKGGQIKIFEPNGRVIEGDRSEDPGPPEDPAEDDKEEDRDAE